VSINVWRVAGDTLNFNRNFLYCNHQVQRDFLITLYLRTSLYHIHCTSFVNADVLCSVSCICVASCTCLSIMRSTAIAQGLVLVSENAPV
jgi:hypothetical protein